MKTFILMLLAALAGAGLFHAYYLNLRPDARCRWDHAFDEHGKADCIQQATAAGYSGAARHEMDDLIGRVSGEGAKNMR